MKKLLLLYLAFSVTALYSYNYNKRNNVTTLKAYINSQDNLDVDDLFTNRKNNRKDTPLMLAVQSGEDEKVKEMLQEGVNPNDVNLDGITALHYAVAAQNVVIVRLLLEYNADSNIQGHDGKTPLHVASHQSAFSIAQELMQYHTDSSIEDNQGRKAIDYARNERMIDILSQ